MATASTPTPRTLQEAHEVLARSPKRTLPVRRIVTRVEQSPGCVKFLALKQEPGTEPNTSPDASHQG